MSLRNKLEGEIFEADLIIRNGNLGELTDEDCNAPRVIFLNDVKQFIVSRGDGTYENITKEISDTVKELQNLDSLRDRVDALETLVDLKKPFEKTLLYYGPPSMIGGAESIAAACDIYSTYDVCIYGDQYEFVDNEEHANTVQVFQYMKSHYPHIKLVGYVPIGVQDAEDDSNLTLDQIYARVDMWKEMGVDGIFLDEFGYDHGVSRLRQNSCVGYCHENDLFVIANAWEIEDVFSIKPKVIDWLNNFEANPDRVPPLMGSEDYYLFENLFYSVETDWEGRIVENRHGTPRIVSSSAQRVQSVIDYRNHVDSESGEEYSWEAMYGTKLMSIDAIPSTVSEREMCRLRSMSVIGAAVLGLDAVAFGDENCGSDGTYFDWTLPPMNLARNGKKGSTSQIKSNKWYQFTYNNNTWQIGRYGGIRVWNGGQWQGHHTTVNSRGRWEAEVEGTDIEVKVDFTSDTQATVVIAGKSYTAEREAINSREDEVYWEEWPSSWTANINGYVYSVVFNLQFADDTEYSVDTHYATMNGARIQNCWESFFDFQDKVNVALDKADQVEQYLNNFLDVIEGSIATITEALDEAEDVKDRAINEINTAKQAQLSAADAIERAFNEVQVIESGYSFREVEW